MIFPQLPIHTHIFFPKNTRLLVNVLVSGKESPLVRRFLIKTPLGKPQRLLVKLLLLLLNNKNPHLANVNNIVKEGIGKEIVHKIIGDKIKMNGSIMEVTDNLLQQLLLNNQYSLAMKSPWERAQ